MLAKCSPRGISDDVRKAAQIAQFRLLERKDIRTDDVCGQSGKCSTTASKFSEIGNRRLFNVVEERQVKTKAGDIGRLRIALYAENCFLKESGLLKIIGCPISSTN